MQEGDIPRAGRTGGRGWDSENLEAQGEGPQEAGTYTFTEGMCSAADDAQELRGGHPPTSTPPQAQNYDLEI